MYYKYFLKFEIFNCSDSYDISENKLTVKSIVFIWY